ncbi:MAG: hypothetical protein K6C05_07640 [Anaerovibrio sp.]|nr:hypothetical protein [Anaerovibrio sp.]
MEDFSSKEEKFEQWRYNVKSCKGARGYQCLLLYTGDLGRLDYGNFKKYHW